MLDEITAPDALELLVTHPYGNYVVQRVISQCTAKQLQVLLKRIHEFAVESDKAPAVVVAAPIGKRNKGKGRSGGQQRQQAEPFRQTVYGRKILEKLGQRESELHGDGTSTRAARPVSGH